MDKERRGRIILLAYSILEALCDVKKKNNIQGHLDKERRGRIILLAYSILEA
jgi:hypothetical protein